MVDVGAIMVAVTVPPVTKGTALTVELFCKHDHRVRVLQPRRQQECVDGLASVGELRMA